MTRISVAEVEARSGIEKRPGETLSEYLRRVGSHADLPADDVEAVVTECQRRQFAGESDAAADAPIEAFLEAADALGGEDAATDADESGAAETTGNGTSGAEEPSADGTTEGSAPARAGTAETDSTDAEDAGGLAFYRSVAVVGVVVLLAAGLLGSTLLLVTDLGPSADDEPETPADTDDLEETEGDEGSDDADESDDGNGDDESESDDADETDGGDGADDDPQAADDTEDTSTDDEAESDEADSEEDDAAGADDDGDDDEPSEPIGFGEGENETDPDADDGNGTDAEETGATAEANETDGVDDGVDAGDENGTDEGSGFGSDETETDDAERESEDEGETDDLDDGDTDPEVVDSTPGATGSLEVTDRAAPGDHPADEYVELTNVGDAALDMSGWTVRDREGGAVDTHGIEPLEFPDGFVLDPGASVRLVTGSGENTSETIHWGHVRQNWRDAGDVVVVADADGEEVLRHPYGDQA